MKIAVPANGTDLDALASPVFGRCTTFVLVDTEAFEYEALVNPALSAGGAAGVQAAQYVVERGAEAVVTGNVGPNAFDVLRAGGIPVYRFTAGTVQQAVQAYIGGHLVSISDATVPAHAGTGRGRKR